MASVHDSSELPLIGLTVGDPAGIGPEIVAAAIGDRDVRALARIVVLGPASLRPNDVPLCASDSLPAAEELTRAGPAQWIATPEPGSFEVGRVSANAGRAAIDALRAGHELALDGRVDALVTAPVNKEALHLGGERVEGQTQLLGRWSGVQPEMLALSGNLRALLLTRHMPLAQAIASIDAAGIEAHLALLDSGLRDFGFDAPRLAVAGLNPHAGENGLLGSEDDAIIAPAVERARARGIDVVGPVSPDAVYLRAAAGEFDAVLALYHDQAFIPLKLHRPGLGLTVLLGLPYLRVSPAHGTAFDIAGTGRADPGNLIEAIRQAAEWSSAKRATR